MGDGHVAGEVRKKVISFILRVLNEHGNLRAVRDRDNFVQQTGAGASKFNIWMKKFGLQFDRSDGVWQPPQGMSIREYRAALKSINRKGKHDSGRNSNLKEVTQPTKDGGWPLLESTTFFDEALSFQKYTSDEIIKLARVNPGIGLNRFVKSLYPSNNRHTFFKIEELLNEHSTNTDEDLIQHLQNPENTKSEFFDWAELVPGFLRNDQASSRKGKESMFSLTSITDLNYDFRSIHQYCQDGYTFGEISRLLELPYQVVVKYGNKLEQWHENDIVEDWLELVDLLKYFSKARGHVAHAEERQDHLILYLRRVTRSYINTPEEWTSRPELSGLSQFFELATTPEDENEIGNSSNSIVSKYLFLDELNHNKNFRMAAMIENGFFDPLFTLVRHQFSNEVGGLRITMGKKVSPGKAMEFLKQLRKEFDCILYISSVSDDLFKLIIEQLDMSHVMVEIIGTDCVEKVSSCANLSVVCLAHSEYMKADLQYAYLNSLSEMLQANGFPINRIFLKPLAMPFFQDENSRQASGHTVEFNSYAGIDYIELVRKLSNENDGVICDCEPFKSGIPSMDNTHGIVHRSATDLSLNSGAKFAIVDYVNYETVGSQVDSDLFSYATQAILAKSERLFEESINGFQHIPRSVD